MLPKTFLKIVFSGMSIAAVVFIVQSTFLNHKNSQTGDLVADATSPSSTSIQQNPPAQPPTASLSESSTGPVATVMYKSRKSKRGEPKIGGKFLLTDQTGRQRSHVDFRGKYTLIYFGYSFCPDICPTALYNITETLEALGDKAKNIQPVFITIDPERDTVSELAKYMENFHPSFIALTGSHQAIMAAKKAYHVYSARAESEGNETGDYLLDHSSIIYVMDPKGQYVTSFNHSTPPETMIKGLLTLF